MTITTFNYRNDEGGSFARPSIAAERHVKLRLPCTVRGTVR